MLSPLTTPADNAVAIQRIGELMVADPAPGSPDEIELLALAEVAEAYEKRVYDFSLSEPPPGHATGQSESEPCPLTTDR